MPCHIKHPYINVRRKSYQIKGLKLEIIDLYNNRIYIFINLKLDLYDIRIYIFYKLEIGLI